MRLVSYDHGTYLDIKEHRLNQKQRKQKETFSRYLEISPDKLQKIYKLFDEQAESDPRALYDSVPKGEIKLGISESLIWGKQYKLRIRSKQTGKIIDVNFKFKYNKQEILDNSGISTDDFALTEENTSNCQTKSVIIETTNNSSTGGSSGSSSGSTPSGSSY